MLDNVFIDLVKADKVTLVEYIEKLSSTVCGFTLVSDLEHWRQCRIKLASQLACYLDQCVERERRKGNLIESTER